MRKRIDCVINEDPHHCSLQERCRYWNRKTGRCIYLARKKAIQDQVNQVCGGDLKIGKGIKRKVLYT